MLDKRLSLCAEFVSEGGVVCDVGTDHAYLVAELLRSGKCRKAVAADIADGPLDAARQTLERYGLLDSVRIIKSDGLREVEQDDITDIVIAGMGGELICEIISCVEWIKNDINLILQPMTRAETLRKTLYENGYEITREQAVIDGEHAYSVICAGYTGRVERDITLQLIYLGKLQKKCKDNVLYIEKLYAQQMQIIRGLEKSGRFEEAKKHREIAEIARGFLKG